MLYYDELTHLQFVACYGEVTPHLAMLFFVLPGAVVLVCYGVIFIVVVKQRQVSELDRRARIIISGIWPSNKKNKWLLYNLQKICIDLLQELINQVN